jgi:hypothetical protein
VEPSLWIKVPSMHLEGASARCFQSVERRVKQLSWDEFCALIRDMYGRV